MVCSYCNGKCPPGGNHNVRTCQALKAMIGYFCTRQVLNVSVDGLRDYMINYGIDAVATGGIATLLSTAVEAYNGFMTAQMLNQFRNLSKREQARFLLDRGLCPTLSAAARAAAIDSVKASISSSQDECCTLL